MSWKHLPHYWPFAQGIHRSLVDSQYKGSSKSLLLVSSLLLVWANVWKQSSLGILRSHCCSHEVAVIKYSFFFQFDEGYSRDGSDSFKIGRIRLSVSTVNHTYELSKITHVTSFRKYGKHSTGPSTYGPWVRTYGKLFPCKSFLTVSSYRAQSNEIHTYGRVSRGSLPRVRLLYLRSNTTCVTPILAVVNIRSWESWWRH